MRVFCALCGLFLAIAIVNCKSIVKRETEEDLSPLNEVYVIEADKDEAADGDKADRDKRKIGTVGVTVGIKNGILNFVFGKIDGFLDAKTKALAVLDESNKAKNAAFGIDPNQSASSKFVSDLISQKIQSATGSIGPLINSATTLFSGASAGFTNALTSKIAPLSSLSGALSGGVGGAGAGSAGAGGSAFIGNLLSQGLSSLSSLSQGSGGLGALTSLSGGLSGGSNSDTSTENSAGVSAGASIGAFANLGGRLTRTTTEDTPIFDRNRVSLEIPSAAFGTSFSLLTNVTKILNSVILNSARRTQTLAELFKPLFRGAFAIKGLPSDNSIN